MSHSAAMEWIGQQSGRHFDPVIVRAAQDLGEQLQAIACRWRD